MYKVNAAGSGGGGGSQGYQGPQGDIGPQGNNGPQGIDGEQPFETTIYDISFSAAAGYRYLIDTSINGAITATLPEFPSIGQAVYFVDAGRNFGTAALTIETDPGAGTTQYINGGASVTVNTTGKSVGAVFIGSNKWITYGDVV